MTVLIIGGRRGGVLMTSLLVLLISQRHDDVSSFQLAVKQKPIVADSHVDDRSSFRQRRHGTTLAAPTFRHRRSSGRLMDASSASTDDDMTDDTSTEHDVCGLYKKFEQHAWQQLSQTGWLRELDIESELSTKEAVAKGPSTNGDTPPLVKITTRAMVPTTNESSSDDCDNQNNGLIRYARIALLETVPQVTTTRSTNGDSVSNIYTDGIQVLNFVVLPCESTTLPVLGIDLVSLPGGRHLLLLDAQPMIQPNPYEVEWNEWYAKHVLSKVDQKFPWGGDFPEPVQQYVSPYALWTRLQGINDDPIQVIQNDVYDAFVDHLDIYLELVRKTTTTTCAGTDAASKTDSQSVQASYLEYRKNNDPAKPMLTSLYGQEWTEKLLHTVLFPKDTRQ